MKREFHFRVLRSTLMVLLPVFSALPLFSQSCALCYTQAASAGSKMIEALRSGILILILPPTLASIGMLFIVHHRRNQYRRDDEEVESGHEW